MKTLELNKCYDVSDGGNEYVKKNEHGVRFYCEDGDVAITEEEAINLIVAFENYKKLFDHHYYSCGEGDEE